jgi:hypothetical protein
MDEMRPDTAGPATPADRRRRRRKNALVFALFLLCVLSGLTATVLSVNNGRNYVRLVRQFKLERYLLPPPPAPRLRIDRQKHLAPAGRYPPWLLAAMLERAAGFAAAPPGDAEDHCLSLKSERPAEVTFTPTGQDWECLAFQEFGAAEERASIFLQARGTVPDLLRTFRIKLSLTDSSQVGTMTQSAIAAVDRFGLALSPESRQYLGDKIAAQVSFSSTLENYRAVFAHEFTDERRFNLLLVPRAQTIGCEGSAGMPEGHRRAVTLPLPIGCLDIQSAVRQAVSPTPDPASPGPDHPPVPTARPEPGSSGG